MNEQTRNNYPKTPLFYCRHIAAVKWDPPTPTPAPFSWMKKPSDRFTPETKRTERDGPVRIGIHKLLFPVPLLGVPLYSNAA